MDTHILLPIALMLAGAKILGEASERFLKMPAVLAEIVVGIVLGKSVFGVVDGGNLILQAIAGIGAVFLLFEVGLECDLDEIFRVGFQSLWVAIAGVTITIGSCVVAARFLGHPSSQALFIAAAFASTSVGITARVFSDLSALQTREARIVLGAAVVDDVIGLIVLAIVSGLATTTFALSDVFRTSSFAIIFLVGAVVIGRIATPLLLKWARKMKTRAAVSMAAVVLCMLMASVAEMVQLAPIIGAFAAGVVLAKTQEKVRFEEKVKSIGDMFVPLFFVIVGARMDLSALTPSVALSALLFVVIACAAKVIAGLSVPGKGIGRWVVGVGMIPRGEVSLIFASIGQTQHLISPAIYASIVFVVIATTFITPPILKLATLRFERQASVPAT